MNTWLKVAGAAVGVLVIIIIIGIFAGGNGSSPPAKQPESEKPKTFYDMAERDRQMLKKPESADEQTEVAESPPEQPVQPAPTEPQQTQQLPMPASPYILPSQLTKPTTLYFKPLGEIEDIEAHKYLNVAVPARSIGRLPITHFKLMVDQCRTLLHRWPDSWYAFRAKQMLEEMPERFWRNYKVTEQELDISKFMKPRPGTQPMTVEPLR